MSLEYLRKVLSDIIFVFSCGMQIISENAGWHKKTEPIKFLLNPAKIQ